MTKIFLLAGLFLMAGVLMVPLAKRFNLGSVLGYIFAGIAISPLLALLHVDVLTLQHFAEFGVVIMLFLVGLELEPQTLWRMKNKLLGLGGLQVAVTIVLVTLAALAFGLHLKTALLISFIFALSSTAIVLQTLNEKGLMNSDGGKDSFSVLLVQDIAVIPILAIIPMLARPEFMSHGDHTDAHHATLSLVHGLADWQRALVTLLVIAVIIFGGIKLSRPFFRYVTSARAREVLVAAALFWVVAISLLMSLVELSPALGTFIAGVVLANSEYRHQLESDIEPAKGLLLGLFFMTVGASIDFGLLASHFLSVLGLTLGVMLLKALVLFGIARLFKMQGANKWLFTLGLAQAGEFAFVLISFAVASAALDKALSDLLLLVVAFSMLLTPLLFIVQEKYLAGPSDSSSQDPDAIDTEAPILIAGHGRFGGVINRMLRGLGYQTIVLDYNYEHLNVLRKFDFKVYYGDATRHDLLHAAGIEKAKLLIVAIDDKAQITEMVKYCVQYYPHLHVIARAVDHSHVYDLYAVGCRDIIRETFDSSVRAGRSALEALGMRKFEAERKARRFVEADKASLRKLAESYRTDIPVSQNKAYIERVKEMTKQNEALLQGEDRFYSNRADRGWSPPSLRDVETARQENAAESDG